MKRWLAAVSIGALAACSKPKAEKPPPPPVSACARVADHLVSLMSGAQKHAPEATDPLRRVVTERCETDRWSDAANQCLLSLASLAEGERCQRMMTPTQIEAFQRDSEAATAELRSHLEPAPAAPAPPPVDAGVVVDSL